MTPIDWFALLHPVFAILFIYPVVGATIRLGILVREKRLRISKQPATVPLEHSDHGRWLTTGSVIAILIAFLFTFLTKYWAAPQVFSGGVERLVLLWVALAGGAVSLLALWVVRRPFLRATFALLCWFSLLALGSQGEIWRVSDNPLSASFWSSHYWAGVLLSGLLLCTTAARPEIQRLPKLRRLHVTLASLIMLLLAVLAITGTRDLLELPLSWQASFIGACDFAARRCS